MTVDLNMFDAIMKNKIVGDNNDTLVITMHENKCTIRDIHITKEVVQPSRSKAVSTIARYSTSVLER